MFVFFSLEKIFPDTDDNEETEDQIKHLDKNNNPVEAKHSNNSNESKSLLNSIKVKKKSFIEFSLSRVEYKLTIFKFH